MSGHGRPPDSLTFEAIPAGPMATSKRKFAAIAKYHAINTERGKKNYKFLKDKDFLEHTGITKEELANAESHKEYVDVALSIAKGQSVMWFRDQLEDMQSAAKRLYDSKEDKAYLQAVMAIADMLKFKEFTLEGMEEAEVRDATETIEEILTILHDDAVLAAIKNEEGLVPQKIIPALVGASFKPRSKKETASFAQLDGNPEKYGGKRPDQLVDTLSETSVGAENKQEIHPVHGSEQDGQK